MYEASDDPYCYPGTTVLKNRRELTLQSELTKLEKFMVAQRSDEPLPRGRLSYNHYRAIHRHLFQDVYVWAGRIRTVRLSKGGAPFCYPEHIDNHMRHLFTQLADDNSLRDLEPADFAAKAAHLFSELNAIHPFREGNGRTQNTFLFMLADQAGHPIDRDRFEPNRLLRAMIASFGGDEGPLADAVRDMLRTMR